MQHTLAALTIILMMGMVIARAVMLRRRGIRAMHFGQLDKSDFLIPPFMLFYFYLVFASAFGWPSVIRSELFQSEALAWLGVLFCLAGLALLGWSLASFGESFRVGIDPQQPGALVTGGAFAVSRNPIYVAFALILAGEFLIYPNWVFVVYLVAAAWLFHRQILREEDSLKQQYGRAYLDYCQRVRRYI